MAQALFGAWFAWLVLGFAVDLDQRLLPDELTLPVIPLALLLDVTGNNPLVGDGRAAGDRRRDRRARRRCTCSSIPFGAGAFGMGDVKLLVGVGLMLGSSRAFSGLLAGLIAAGLVLASCWRRSGSARQSFVPFGPFLIFGALWGIFVTP